MNKFFALVVFLFLNQVGFSQYYFKDIVSVKQANSEMAAYKENKVKKIKVKSFEANGEPSEGFFFEKNITKDYRKTELYIRTISSPKALTISNYNEKGWLENTIDSSDIFTTRNSYFYDESGRLLKISTAFRSADDDFVNTMLEEHVFVYGDDYFPDKMYKIIDRKDSSAILFVKDEAGNIAVEKDLKSGNIYYYYYDEKSRLTDIVHSTEYNNKMIADYIFEYGSDNKVSQMISTEAGKQNYVIWKYQYQNGMVSKERVYDKKRKLMGYVEYEYL